eukprot:scpid73800/ scgid6869/ 
MSGGHMSLQEALCAMSMMDTHIDYSISSTPTTPRRPAASRSPLPLVLVTNALGGETKTSGSPSSTDATLVGSSGGQRLPRSPSTSSTVSQSPTLSPVREVPVSDDIQSTRARRPPSSSHPSLYLHRASLRTASPYGSILKKKKRNGGMDAVERRRRRRRLRGIVSDDESALECFFECPPPSPSSAGEHTEDSQSIELAYMLGELRTSSPAPSVPSAQPPPPPPLSSDNSPQLSNDEVFAPSAITNALSNQQQQQQWRGQRPPHSDSPSLWSQATNTTTTAAATATAAMSSVPTISSISSLSNRLDEALSPFSCGVQQTCRQCASRQFSTSSSSCNCRPALNTWDDTTPDELASYIQHTLYLPREMSDAAKMMYA